MKTSATLTSTIALMLGLTSNGVQSAPLPTGAKLTISSGVTQFDANGNPTNVTVSWFGMDTTGNSKIAGNEKTALSQGTTGIVIGSTTTAGASHGGCPVAGDTNTVTAPWCFFGNAGSDYLTVAATGSTTAGLSFSGWTVTWNGIPAINMGSGAWEAGYSTGVANITWSGVNGDPYTLDYSATVPAGDPSGFGGVRYHLHLEGTVVLPGALTASSGTLADGDLGGTLANNYRPTTNPPADTGYTNSGGYFDYKVSCGAAGCTDSVVIPLTGAIPADAVLRKYSPNTGLWSTFDTSAGDTIESADSASGGGDCTAATYSAGLTVGHDCLRLTQSEGGLNDTDATASDGVYGDPSGLATADATNAPTVVAGSGSSGCTLASRPASLGAGGDWLLVGAALAGLGLIRRRVS